MREKSWRECIRHFTSPEVKEPNRTYAGESWIRFSLFHFKKPKLSWSALCTLLSHRKVTVRYRRKPTYDCIVLLTIVVVSLNNVRSGLSSVAIATRLFENGLHKCGGTLVVLVFARFWRALLIAKHILRGSDPGFCECSILNADTSKIARFWLLFIGEVHWL